MRTKTNEKRREILAAAEAEFGLRGFHDATLTHVAERMGSSKATIYNYFRSKEELFGAMVATAALPNTANLLALFDSNRPFTESLRIFSQAFVRVTTGECSVALQRLLIANSERAPETVRPIYENPDAHPWARIASLLRHEQEQGRFRQGDHEEMTGHLRALLQGDLPVRLLFGEQRSVSEAEIIRSADAAVSMFLLAYAQ